MFKLRDLKQAVGEVVQNVVERAEGKSKPFVLEKSVDKVAEMYNSREGANYRRGLEKMTLMTDQGEEMFDQYIRTIECWEMVKLFVERRLYTHPRVVDYVELSYSGLAVMELNEEEIEAKLSSVRA